MIHTLIGALRACAFVAAGVFVLVVAPLMIGRALVTGLRTGVIMGHRMPYSRAEEPVLYWLQVGIDVAVLAGWVWLVGAVLSITPSNR